MTYDLFIHVVSYDKHPLPVGGTTLPVADLERVLARKGVLLWCYRGSYAVIPAPILENFVAFIRASQQAETFAKDRTPAAGQVIAWSQALPVESNAVRAMLHQLQQADEARPGAKAKAKGKADSQGK